ncbi:cellulose binding domain-containing protein [Dactylosporangium cerinum]
MTTNFNPAQLTTFGDRIVNGANGLKATSREASVYSGQTTSPAPSSPSVSVSPSRSPSVSPSASRSPSSSPGGTKACTATYAIVGQWPGGFQAEVKVTAGSAAISGWTVGWTYTSGQTVNNAWSATVTSSGAAVTARNVNYNGTVGAGASTSFGFLGSWTGTNSVPAPLTCSAT